MGLDYKSWKCRQKLHTKEGWSCMTNWISDVIINKNILYKFKWLLLLAVISLGVWIEKAQADYSFPYEEPYITMDVEKTDGGGGTLVCPSVQACYIYTLQQEARGATQYCESITIKRNGRTVWQRKYW